MTLHAGTFLKSTLALDETLFENVVVLLTEYNNNGAVGFVTNKPSGKELNELEEFKTSPDFALYDGGPVDKEHLFFIHKRPDIIEGSSGVDGIYNGGNFQQAVAAINNNTISKRDLKIFIGYCGWDAGELEAEIEEGSWEVVEGQDLFGA